MFLTNELLFITTTDDLDENFAAHVLAVVVNGNNANFAMKLGTGHQNRTLIRHLDYRYA